MSTVREVIVGQFEKPAGLLGRVVSLVMQVRPSNRERSARTIALLDIQPRDDVLEIGFGPGLAIARVASATRGKVVGIDHSSLMLKQANRRNAQAIAEGRVELLLGSADRLPDLPTRFDKVFAVNVYMFWENPIDVLRGVRGVMKPGATIALTVQPRNRKATNADALDVARQMEASLREAGFESVRCEMLEMSPVNAACVIGRAPENATSKAQ